MRSTPPNRCTPPPAPVSVSTTTWTTTRAASRSAMSFAFNQPRPQRRGFCLYVAQTLLSVVLLAACGGTEPAPKQTPRRIVTLAPNVTEMVVALGAGHRIVATDDYSADAMPQRKLPRVGGLQPNVEKIVAARPDLVIANAAAPQPNPGRSLAPVHIPLLVVPNERPADITKPMPSTANALGISTTPAVTKLNASLA